MSLKIATTCPQCGHQTRVDTMLVGQTFQCLKCGNRFTVQPAPSAPEEAASFVRVACECGKRFRVAAEHVGRKAACPACGRTLTITAEPTPDGPAPEPRAQASQPDVRAPSGSEGSGPEATASEPPVAGADLRQLIAQAPSPSHLITRLAILAALAIPIGALVAFIVVKFTPGESKPASPVPPAVTAAPVVTPPTAAQSTTQPQPAFAVSTRPTSPFMANARSSQPAASGPAADTPGELARFEVEGGEALAVAFSPDGRKLAFGGLRKSSRVYLADLTTKRVLWSRATVLGTITGLCFLPDGNGFISGTDEYGLQRWAVDIDKPQQLGRTFAGLRSMALSDDGLKLLTAGDEGRITLWQLPSCTKIREFQTAHAGVVKSVAFASRVNLALSGGEDRVVRLWDVETGQPVAQFTGHTNSVYAVAISPDGRVGMSAGEDATVRVWDLVRRSERACLKAHQEPVRSLAISPDGQFAFSVAADRSMWMYDLRNSKPIMQFEGHKGTIRAVALSPDGRLAATASEDHTVRVWRLPLAQNDSTITASETDETRIVATKPPDAPPGLVVEYKIDTGTYWPHVAYSPDGKYLAASTGHGAIKLWDLDTKTEAVRLSAAASGVAGFAFSPEGDTLLSAGVNGQMTRWDYHTGRAISHASANTTSVRCLAVSPKGSLAAFTDNTNTLYYWDIQAGSFRRSTRPKSQLQHCLAFRPDGSGLIVGGWDPDKITVYDFGGGYHQQHGGVSWIYAIAASPDSNCVAVGGCKSGLTPGSDPRGALELWDLKRSEKPRVLPGHDSPVITVAFSPDGRYVASGSGSLTNRQGAGSDKPDNSVRIWEVQTLRLIHQFEGHGDYVTHVTFSPDGKYIASIGRDSLARIWQMPEAITASIADAGAAGITEVDLTEVGRNLNTTFPALLKENKLHEAAGLLKESETALQAYARQNNVKLWDKKVSPLMRRVDERLAELDKLRASAATQPEAAAGVVDVPAASGGAPAERPRNELSEEEAHRILGIRKTMTDLSELIRSGKLSLARSRLSQAKTELEGYVKTQNLAEWNKTISAVFQLADQRLSEIASKDKADRDKLDKAARDLKEKQDAAKLAAQLQAGAKSSEGLAAGTPAPDLVGLTLDGKPFNSTILKGKWVLVDFWATWCGPCVGEIPNLQKTYEAFGKDKRFAMVSLSIDNTPDDLRKYVESRNMGWHQVFLPGKWESPLIKTWNVHGIPRILLVNPKGIVVANGLRGEAILLAVKNVLGEK